MSPTFDLVIRGGRVVTETDDRVTDIGVVDGRIVEIAGYLGPGREEVWAGGTLVLPGGVDTHCHVEQESCTGVMTADDFFSATVSAACGGTTTIMPLAAQHRGQSLRAVVEDYKARAAARAAIDYAFHLIVSDPTETALREELPAIIDEGHASMKVFMTCDALKLTDRQILQVLEVAWDHGATVMVHAENGDAVAWRTERLLATGNTAPRHHADAHPTSVEREATHRAIALAQLVGTPLFIVNVSCAEAAEEIARARARGIDVRGETCPHYLVLDSNELRRPGFEGAKYICSPPLRTLADQDALWVALQTDVLEVVASDHAPYRYDDPAGKKAHGEDAPFTRVPNGLPGLETRLPLLFSEGVRRGRLDLHKFVALTAANPARIFGLYPRKGTLAVGSDADIAIWDLTREVTIAQARLHDRMDYTPYEGLQVRGWPVTTISRGEVVWRDGEVRARPGRGQLIPRRSFR